MQKEGGSYIQQGENLCKYVFICIQPILDYRKMNV